MNWKTITTKTFALLTLTLIAVPTYSENGGGCPAFNAGMVDAAILATDFSQTGPLNGFAVDSPNDASIVCGWVTETDSGFWVQVEDGVAQVIGNALPPGPDETGKLRIAVFDLSVAQQRACRAQVLKSFAWQQLCKPLMQ